MLEEILKLYLFTKVRNSLCSDLFLFFLKEQLFVVYFFLLVEHLLNLLLGRLLDDFDFFLF